MMIMCPLMQILKMVNDELWILIEMLFFITDICTLIKYRFPKNDLYISLESPNH